MSKLGFRVIVLKVTTDPSSDPINYLVPSVMVIRPIGLGTQAKQAFYH